MKLEVLVTIRYEQMTTQHSATDALWRSLATVDDPEIRRPITDLGMVERAEVLDGVAWIEILLTIVGCPAATSIERQVREAALRTPGVETVELRVGVMTPEQRKTFIERVRGNSPRRLNQFGEGSLTRVLAVTSGKGGVGKSTVTANLAVALAHSGLRVGIIDADIFGFSIPGLMGLVHDGVTASPTRIDEMIVAPEAHGVSVISIGMFLGGADSRETAVSWRGPMLHRTLEQFLSDVWFGDLDVLFIDLPPGTGDVAISLGQLLPQAEVLVVTTPQQSAADVAVRSGVLARNSGQRLIGVIETMSPAEHADGSTFDLFGSGGGAEVAERLGVPLLASVPLSITLRRAGDRGIPLVIDAPTDPAAQELMRAAARIAKRPDSLAGKRLPLQI